MINKSEFPTFNHLYLRQVEFQKMLGNTEIPKDDPEMLAHHMLGLISEVGELSQADKRWKKNGRNRHFDFHEKLYEIADCFVFLINICIYSGITPFMIMTAVEDKIEKNIKRYKGEKTNE